MVGEGKPIGCLAFSFIRGAIDRAQNIYSKFVETRPMPRGYTHRGILPKKGQHIYLLTPLLKKKRHITGAHSRSRSRGGPLACSLSSPVCTLGSPRRIVPSYFIQGEKNKHTSQYALGLDVPILSESWHRSRGVSIPFSLAMIRPLLPESCYKYTLGWV